MMQKKLLIDEFYPNDVISYKSISFNNFETLLKDYKDFLKGNDVIFNYKQNITNKTELFFTKNITNQVSKIIINTNSETENNIFYIGQYNKQNNSIIKNITYKNYTINKLEGKNLIQMILENNINKNNFQYYTIINNYIIFGKTVLSIQTLINIYITNNRLISQNEYFKFKNSSIGKANLFNYINPVKINNYLNYNIKQKYFDYIPEFEKLIGISSTHNYENKLIYTTINLQYQSDYNKLSDIKWNLQIDTTISQIFLFENENKKEQYTIIQDLNNNIYLYDLNGVLIDGWPKKVASQIIQNISVINYYNNANKQILFNTIDSLYIIDVKGNNIENYPKKLKYSTSYSHKYNTL